MCVSLLRWAYAGLFVVSFVGRAAAESWEIIDNAYHSYFNVGGDATSVLKQGTKVRLKGRTNTVHLTHAFDDGKYTYVQLEEDHGASVGDTLTLASDTGSESKQARTATKTTTAPAEDTSKQEEAPVGEFSADLPFVSAVSIADVKAEAKAQQKPALVFVTQPWCGACKHLKTSVSRSASIKSRMKEFVVAHAAAEAGEEWQGPGKSDGYIPRIYFLSTSGEFIDAPSPNGDYPYFFPDASALESAMSKVLSKHKTASDEL